MKSAASNKKFSSEDQLIIINQWLKEISDFKKQLDKVNERLWEAANYTCSEYGDRKLEFIQSKLIHMRHLLNFSVTALNKHKEALSSSSQKNHKQLNDYFNKCNRSAKIIQHKIKKYYVQTNKTFDEICA